MHRIEQIKALLAKDKLDQAINELQRFIGKSDSELANELIMHQARLNRTQTDRRRGLIAWGDEERERTQIRFALLDMLSKVTVDSCPIEGEKITPSVFISYSRADQAVATSIVTLLRGQGLRVQIDYDDLGVGEDIQAFILRSVRDTDATVCIVSRTSLLSPWVGMETVNTFHSQKWAQPKNFIACFLEDGFFDPGFRLEATKEIDARIHEIDKLIPSYIEQKMDTVELNDEKTRLFELRNNLGMILHRLKNYLSLDLRQPHFDKSIERIVETLRSTSDFLSASS